MAKVANVKSAKAKVVKPTAEQFVANVSDQLAKCTTAETYTVVAKIAGMPESFETTNINEALSVVNSLMTFLFEERNKNPDFEIKIIDVNNKGIVIRDLCEEDAWDE